ncbi:O-antigen ligase family protein [Acholeplasma hippikon]|nr:O-antigen ligase family protein [Acholeplasma hippikon]
MFLFSIPLVVILVLFKSTIATAPLLISCLFIIGFDADISTIDSALSGILNVILIVIGFIVHFIRFKPKFKLKSLGLGLLLASVSYIIPLIYTPVNEVSILLVFLVPFYLVTYLFYANTIDKNELNYLMRFFLYTSIMLSFQLIALMSDGFKDFKFLHDLAAFQQLHVDSPAWGNVNDLTIQLVLMSSCMIFYLKKYKNILPWLYLGWMGFWIIISDSRGSIVTITLYAIGVAIYVLFKGRRHQRINLLITIILTGIFMYVFRDLVTMVYRSFMDTINFDDPNGMLTGRLTLWFDPEYGAVTVFKRYPIFGSGWNTPHWFLNEQNRITIYHSTFFQVLATGGLVGILILIYHFYEVGKLFVRKRRFIAVKAFLFTYLLTQFHGLIDNTQYMIHYSLVTLIAFAVIDNANLTDIEIGVLGDASVN